MNTMKKAAAVASAMLMLCSTAVADSIRMNGETACIDPVHILAPASGRIVEVYAAEGDTLSAGDMIAEIATDKVYAQSQGTVYYFGSVGESAERITKNHGGIAVIEPEHPWIIQASIYKAYNKNEARIVHPDQSVYFQVKGRKETAYGHIIALDESMYTVEVTSGTEVKDGDKVIGYRTSFDEITYVESMAGQTYTYTIRELTPAEDDIDNPVPGVTYDTTPHMAVVTVTKDEDNKLTAVAKYDDADSLTVTNTYEATKAELRGIAADELEIEGRFTAMLDFGTAGLRGIMRAGLMSRVKEVGIYRAIGVTKGNLIFRFLIEALVLCAVTVLTGFLAMSLLMRHWVTHSALMKILFHYPLWMMLLLFLLLVFLCAFCGVLPVMLLLRKTPSEILAKYDI